ncbi:F0F1 ATP synthase subunit delta [Acidiferrobacter sp.]|uniref:F0F1 ATP synthase subunit delta n=1 Tax=Acidiferrobacter sp. TaxID=1872107 RepID=UPI00260C3FCC|nr:F0F1 ATP synthase subunit delta [Acidiferrobacter sp.]
MISDQSAVIARPYARALMAVPGVDRAALLAHLAAAAQALSDPSVAALAQNPALARARLTAALVPDLPDSSPLARLIDLLLRNDRLAALPGIAAAFSALKDAAENRTQAVVTTAQPLTEAQHERLRSALARRTGQSVELVVETDPQLLAGIIVQHGDMVLDGSIRGRLAALAHALSY